MAKGTHRGRRVLMTTDTVGGGFTYALELSVPSRMVPAYLQAYQSLAGPGPEPLPSPAASEGPECSGLP